jgi:hypothetical protein
VNGNGSEKITETSAKWIDIWSGGEPMIDAINATSGNSTVEYTPTFSHTPVVAQDSVVLSVDAQAKLLEQRGFSVDEIANQLGLSTGTVQSDLGISIVSAQTKVAAA